jgi:hypothetical protein
MHGNQEAIPVAFKQNGFVSRQTAWGDMIATFESAPRGIDTRPLFHGLPGDSCQCPHWGYLISGRMRVIYQDHEELVSAGEAYYLAPGHNIICEEDGETIEFSPRDEYQKTLDAVAAQMADRQNPGP